MNALILAVLPAIWLVWAIAAPSKEGRRAMHTLWCITLPAGVSPFVAVQERGEWRLSKLLALAAGLPFPVAFALGVAVEPSLLLLVILAQAVAMILTDNGTRRMNAIDYAGHGAEIMAAERAGLTGYREAEIERIRDDRDKRGQDIGAQLGRLYWLARIVFVLGRR